MAFDLSTAKPAEKFSGGFDIATARPADSGEPANKQLMSSSDIEAKFPYPEKPNVQIFSPQDLQRKTIAEENYARKVQEVDRLRELARTNPYQAENIQGMGEGKKALVGIGAGLHDIAVGAQNFGILPWKTADDNGESMQSLEQVSPETKISRAVGQALPFVPAGLAATAPKALGLRMLGGATVGATEGATVAEGTGGNPITGALVGAAFGGLSEPLLIGVSRIGGALVSKYFGKGAQALDAAGMPTPELTAALQKEGLTLDDIVNQAKTTAPSEATGSLSPERIARNTEREDAFKKFGVMPTEAQRTRDKDLFRMQQDRAKASTDVAGALDTQEQAFNQAANKAVDETGGTPANAAISPIDVVVNRSLKQDAQISDAYKSARESSNSQKIIKFNNAASVLRQSAPENELSGGVVSALKGHLEQNGILTGFNPTGKIDAAMAEEMRKYANSLFPSTNDKGRTILRNFKNAIDNDTASAVGEDVFSGARSAKASFEQGLDREKFHKFDERDVNIVRDILNNKVTPDEIQQGSLIKAGSKYKAQDLMELKRYLHSGDPEDVAAGAQAWNDVRASAMQHIKDKAFTGAETELGTQALSRAKLNQALNEIGQQKFNVLFSPQEKQFLYDLSSVAKFKEPPSGTFMGSGPSAPAIKQLESRIENIFGVNIPILSGIKGKIADKQILKINDDLSLLEKKKLEKELQPKRQLINSVIISGGASSSGEDKKQ